MQEGDLVAFSGCSDSTLKLGRIIGFTPRMVSIEYTAEDRRGTSLRTTRRIPDYVCNLNIQA
jgi:hypothetical protein